MLLDEATDLERLLAAVPDGLRARVEAVLADPRRGGRGLRAWLGLMEAEHRPLPAALPAELIEVYLRDGEAEPLYDCENCGLPVPVQTGWRAGHEPTADRVYFPVCPACGGRTGPYAFWTRTASTKN
jgi:hypothetical protein